jgi:hypothetical protein
MRRSILSLFVLVLTGSVLAGCGCGGEPGLSEVQGFTASAPGVPSLDVALIGPANAAMTASATEEVAAIVTFAHTGTLTRVDLLLAQGATAGALLIEVRPVVGGLPDPNVLLASAGLDGSALPPAPGLVTVDLTALHAHVTAGQTVAVVLRSAGGTAGWWGPSSDWSPAAHRARRTRPSPGAPWGPWQASTTGDLCFQVWIAPD